MEELKTFKEEAAYVLQSAKFPSKILSHVWNKVEDMLDTTVPHSVAEQVTKRTILSKLPQCS